MRTMFTLRPSITAERTSTSLPAEKIARRAATLTSARFSSRSGARSPSAGPMRTSFTRPPSPVRIFVETLPMLTVRPAL